MIIQSFRLWWMNSFSLVKYFFLFSINAAYRDLWLLLSFLLGGNLIFLLFFLYIFESFMHSSEEELLDRDILNRRHIRYFHLYLHHLVSTEAVSNENVLITSFLLFGGLTLAAVVKGIL